jgi:hypothetical protein
MKTLIILLCRKSDKRILSLKKEIKKYYDCIIISDSEITLDKKYNNLLGYNRISYFHKPRITAWEKSFFYLINNNKYKNYKFVYFIEDDVYSKNNKTFIELFRYWENYKHDLISKDIISIKNSKTWFHWYFDKKYLFYFRRPYKSFNPLCRLSQNLIEQIYNHYKKYQCLYFHEIIFPSIAIKYQYSYLDYLLDKKSKNFIGEIRWRPEFKIKDIIDNKIYHPVKEIVQATP